MTEQEANDLIDNFEIATQELVNYPYKNWEKDLAELRDNLEKAREALFEALMNK